MNGLPLLERELTLALRRRYGAYKVRLFCGAGAMAVAFWILTVWSAWHPTAGFGRPFLHLLAGLGYIGALLAGILLMSDSISGEKREGTLDLLLLTDLRIRDVILEQLFAKAIVPVCGFIAMVPALEVSVLLGGANGAECARLFLVWTNALLFSLAASTLVSTLCLEQRTAHAGAILLVVAACVAVPWIGNGLSFVTGNGTWRFLSLLISPHGLYQFGTNYATAKVPFWSALVINQLLFLALLILANLALARRLSGTHVNPQSTACLQKRDRRLDQRREDLEIRPMQWLAARKTGRPVLLWTWCLAAIVLLLIPFDGRRQALPLLLLASMHVVVKFAVATSATHAFALDRRSGALESLLATALGTREVADGTRRALYGRFAGPVVVLDVVTILVGVRQLQTGAIEIATILLLAALLLPLDCYCACSVGLFQGLAARSTAAALAVTLFEIVALPWAWVFVASQVFLRSSFAEWLILWGVLTAVNHWWFVSNARANFLRHFRTLALKPFGAKNPVMESDWSPINWDEEETNVQTAST